MQISKSHKGFLILLIIFCSCISLYAQENKEESAEESGVIKESEVERSLTVQETMMEVEEKTKMQPGPGEDSLRQQVVGITATKEEPEEPIVVDADRFEFSTDKREFTAIGNVVVVYKELTLTCDKLKLNSKTKDCEAEGNARLEETSGVTEGIRMVYNFDTKKGTIIDSDFRSNPYFGQADKVNKISETEFIAQRGYFTTCSFDTPHWRMKTRRMNFFAGDKIQSKDDVFYLRKVPLLYLPQYNHSLKDPMMHIQLMPGKSKEWGPFLLTATRYNLTENVSGRIYLDYRSKMGIAEGLGSNYTTDDFGRGDFKHYYTQERARNFEEGDPAEFQRYFIRWRHKWEIDKQTNLISQYYKIVDSKRVLQGSKYNILKEYFPREYDKDPQPLSYLSAHHSSKYSSLDLLIQKRTNRWYSQTEKLPEIRFNLPSYELLEEWLYFDHTSSYANINQKTAVPSPSFSDVTENKIDTTNKLSLPVKAAFLRLNPFLSNQLVHSDKGAYGSTLDVVFSTGSDASTKFYRIFNVNTNFLKLDINNLRHIITPSIAYTYSNTSTMSTGKSHFGGNTSFGSSSASLGISNKLQTKRKRQSVDLLNFNVTSTYAFRPKTGDKRGSNLGDILFDLDLLPYSWLRVNVDVNYKHSGNRSDVHYKKFSTASYDLSFEFAKERTITLGQRYQRKGGNEITLDIDWRLNPKWKFSLYQRRNRGHDPSLKRGLRDQQYTLTRDLHCWSIELTYDRKRGAGEAVWLILRLKAFPEMEFEYNKSYHSPKPGSQSNP